MSYQHDQHNPTTVLVIDDYPFMRLVLRHILERGGYRVIAEANCSETEVLDKYILYRPAITVLDTSMRREESLGVARAILARDAAAVVIPCDFNSGETAGRAGNIGTYGVLVKPYATEQVLKVMQAAKENIRKQ